MSFERTAEFSLDLLHDAAESGDLSVRADEHRHGIARHGQTLPMRALRLADNDL